MKLSLRKKSSVLEFKKINTNLIKDALNKNKIPIIAPLGIGLNNQTFNINGDTAASAIAKKLDLEGFY